MASKTWNIDTAHSGIHFSVRHMVVAKVRGRFASWNGSVHFDPQDLTRANVEVEIDAASIDTGVGDRDAHLRSADFLNAERFPKLRFKSTRVDNAGSDHFRVIGELTIRGVTREVALEVEYGGRAKDPWGHTRDAFAATASIDRGDFGLEWNQKLETGGVLVGERVAIEIEIEAVAPADAQAA